MSVTRVAMFVGADLHKSSVTLRVVRADSQVLGHLTCSTKAIERIEQWIAELPGPRWMAVEACSFVEWFIDRHTPCVGRMDIADPQLTQLRKLGRRGDITKAGSATLRCAPYQAAVTLSQSDAKQEATKQRFIARMPKAKRRDRGPRPA